MNNYVSRPHGARSRDVTCDHCSFETPRLIITPWHLRSDDQQDLAESVAGLLSPPVTRSLPTAWQGDYTVARALEWIQERNADGPMLLVTEKSTGRAIGLVILFEATANGTVGRVEIRIGYLLAEAAWGRGLASELLSGFVDWCGSQPAIASLVAGVERDNIASKRVLEKSGFQLRTGEGDPNQEFVLDLR